MTRPRSGLRVPPAAAGVVQMARVNGWGYSGSWGWTPDKVPFYRVTVARRSTPGLPYVHAVLVWHADDGNGALKLNTAVYRLTPGGSWGELLSLRILSNFMHTGAGLTVS